MKMPMWSRLGCQHLFQLLKRTKLKCLSLVYNEHLSWSYLADSMIEPLFWIIDHCTHLLGPIFALFVALLKLSVVIIAYVIGLPVYWQKSPLLAVILVIAGQYFKVNLFFHYWLALTLRPGAPPTSTQQRPFQAVAVCKKCIAPKPARAHHCSVCDVCVLAMDHHCPWLNNCVGHYNRRHFFLYMLFTVFGCLFIMIFGFEIAYEEIMLKSSNDEFYLFSERSLIIYEAFLTTGCFLVLGGLCLWHSRLITRGETSIEAHINRAEKKRMAVNGKSYKNPYDFSPVHNWKLFLGMIDGRGWECVLLPSAHPPKGDGISFDSIYSCDIQWSGEDTTPAWENSVFVS